MSWEFSYPCFFCAVLSAQQQFALFVLERFGEKGYNVTVTNCSMRCFTYLNSVNSKIVPLRLYGIVDVSPNFKQPFSRANNSVTGVEITFANYPCRAVLTVI